MKVVVTLIEQMKTQNKDFQNALQELGITNQEQLELYIQKELEYLTSEGFTVQMPNANYRLKTKGEQNLD